MDIYEKAKAYDDAIRKADDIRKGNCETPFVYSQELFEYLFPLEESEDEKIREKLIDTFNFYHPAMNSPFLLGIHRKDIIAWLKKQGQVKESEIPQPIKETSKENDNSLTKKAWSKDDEQYLLVCKNALAKYQVTDKWDSNIISKWLDNKLKSIRIEQKSAWSEEDIRNIQDIDSVLFYDKDLPEETCMRLRNWLKSLKPHTEMVEALRTEYEKGRTDTLSEMKSSWSEEDEKTLNEIFSVAARASLRKSTLFGKSYDYIKWRNWLKSLRDRVQSQPKQEWSEEDDKMLHTIIADFKSFSHNNTSTLESHFNKCIDWLKSLRLQTTWKPSEEQIKTCKEVYADILSAKGFDLGTVNNELNRLEEQLKKLTE